MNKDEFLTIAEIGKRAHDLFAQCGVKREVVHCIMDIEKVHDTIGLELDALLAADDPNFAHDIGGIARHLNRQTGELEDCFVPRFAKHGR